MARIRSIKPTFFRSRSVKKLSDKAKLAWIALWNVADDEGRLADELGILTGDLWALGLSESRLDKVLDELDLHGRIIRYEVAGQGFIQVTGWAEHQKINRPTASLLPPAPFTEAAVNAHPFLTVGKERIGEEGKGGGASVLAEPPLFCFRHVVTRTDAPCPACGDARRAHDAWSRAQKNVVVTSPRLTRPPVCEHERPLGDCPYCEEAVAS